MRGDDERFHLQIRVPLEEALGRPALGRRLVAGTVTWSWVVAAPHVGTFSPVRQSPPSLLSRNPRSTSRPCVTERTPRFPPRGGRAACARALTRENTEAHREKRVVLEHVPAQPRRPAPGHQSPQSPDTGSHEARPCGSLQQPGRREGPGGPQGHRESLRCPASHRQDSLLLTRDCDQTQKWSRARSACTCTEVRAVLLMAAHVWTCPCPCCSGANEWSTCHEDCHSAGHSGCDL